MKVNSRGRAALREAHGTNRLHHPTLKGSNRVHCQTLSGSSIFASYSVGVAQSRSPTATNFGPSGTEILLKKTRSWLICYANSLKTSFNEKKLRNLQINSLLFLLCSLRQLCARLVGRHVLGVPV